MIDRRDQEVHPDENRGFYADSPLFRSFFLAGFECSTHRMKGGKRLDLVSSTKHDHFARQDFQVLRTLEMATIREGARWHLIEAEPGHYNFDSLVAILDAARDTGMEVILDLLHFGWPDHLDIFGSEFVPAFGRFTYQVTKLLKSRGTMRPFLAPINEISFLSWAGGDAGFINPFVTSQGHALKQRLAEAAIHSSRIIRQELPAARLVSPEPVIHIAGDPDIEGHSGEAERYRVSQFEAWDMLSGRLDPDLGGKAEYLDIIGVNFYDRNQWVHDSPGALLQDDPRYRPFREILNEVWQRYQRPIFVSETGTEDIRRSVWLQYISQEVLAAIRSGIPVAGICLYPILNHPGWEDDRHCHNGLFDYADESGHRPVYAPLAAVLREQQERFTELALERNDWPGKFHPTGQIQSGQAN